MSPINGSGGSGSGSAENLSSGSNNQTSSASRGNTSNTTSTESFKPPTLTESLLNRHNEDMEKLMMQKHRELRSSIKASDKLKDSRIKTTEKMSTDPNMHFINQSHGVKRSGSHSWEGDSFKVSNSTINTRNFEFMTYGEEETFKPVRLYFIRFQNMTRCQEQVPRVSSLRMSRRQLQAWASINLP